MVRGLAFALLVLLLMSACAVGPDYHAPATPEVARLERRALDANLDVQAEASRRAARIAEIQCREGQINFLVLLDAQRTELEAEDQVAQAETAVNTGAVAVYKALGGVPAGQVAGGTGGGAQARVAAAGQ